MAGLGAARAVWNKSLLSDVAADAYARLVHAAAHRHVGPGPLLHALWPQRDAPAPWQVRR